MTTIDPPAMPRLQLTPDELAALVGLAGATSPLPARLGLAAIDDPAVGRGLQSLVARGAVTTSADTTEVIGAVGLVGEVVARAANVLIITVAGGESTAAVRVCDSPEGRVIIAPAAMGTYAVAHVDAAAELGAALEHFVSSTLARTAAASEALVVGFELVDGAATESGIAVRASGAGFEWRGADEVGGVIEGFGDTAAAAAAVADHLTTVAARVRGARPPAGTSAS